MRLHAILPLHCMDADAPGVGWTVGFNKVGVWPSEYKVLGGEERSLGCIQGGNYDGYHCI